MSIRVLVVDDSAVMRALIRQKLQSEPDIQVVASAQDAIEARKLIKQHDPDVVTLDIEMPGMDGLSFLEKIMALRPTPVIIVSGSTQDGAEATARALKLGAVNCYAKSTPTRSLSDDDGGELARLVREAATIKLAPPIPLAPASGDRASSTHRDKPVSPDPIPTLPEIETRREPPALPPVSHKAPQLIVVGSSTGGVEALHALLSGFPKDCPPTLIVQHVSACFAGAIVQSLNRIAAPEVALAESDNPLRPGHVWLAPGEEKHLVLARAGADGWRTAMRSGEKVTGHRPSVDKLFHSTAENAGPAALGILLTGMGQDGAAGLRAMAETGSPTIAQDEDSCVVFGMPRAAIALGGARKVLPLSKIAKEVVGACRGTTSITDHQGEGIGV